MYRPKPKRTGALGAAMFVVFAVGGMVTAAPAHADSAVTCTDTSSVDGPIAGCMAATRAERWQSANGGTGVPYNTATGSSGFGNYRADCSGFVSYALHISDTTPTPGGLVSGQMYESNGFVDVAKDNLQQGDVLTNPSSLNLGHVVLFDHWSAPARQTDSLP